MGSKDDWCSCKGLGARAKGVQKESCQKKTCLLIIFALAAVIYLAIGSLHLERAANANKLNADFDSFETSEALAYDSCYVPGFEWDPATTSYEKQQLETQLLEYCDILQGDDECMLAGTGWTGVWNSNGIIMVLQAVNFILMAIGAFFFWPRFVGTIVNCCCGCCHCTVIAGALASVFSPFGLTCTNNVAPSTYLGEGMWDESGPTYQDDGKTMQLLAFVQVFLWFLQCCICWIPLSSTPYKNKSKKTDEEKAEKKRQKELKKGGGVVSQQHVSDHNYNQNMPMATGMVMVGQQPAMQQQPGMMQPNMQPGMMQQQPMMMGPDGMMQQPNGMMQQPNGMMQQPMQQPGMQQQPDMMQPGYAPNTMQ